MKTNLLALAACLLILNCPPTQADPRNPNTDWLSAAQYGVFLHFLPGDAEGFARVKDFDVEALARQLESMGARYLVLTLGQNSGFFNSPNAAYDRITGHAEGERCSRRDLPLDLHRALEPRGIRLMLYLPCQVPNQDARAQRAFGLPEGPKDQPLSVAFARKWARVIQEWSDRYGERVAGWWFDGGYEHIHFSEAIAELYAAAAKHGNPKGIVTFNPGVRVIRHTQAEDYTAGELNEPLETVPNARWLEGSQWHALTYLGSNWGRRDTRHAPEQWARWVAAVVAKGGAVTLDLGPNWNLQEGPIGALAEAQVSHVMAIRDALRPASRGASVPQRLKRADSFLGIHYDFHAGQDCTEIGKNTTREMVENIIQQVRPDYIQIDCKGHPGLSSYPTRAGNPAPGFVGDPLRLWRQVTAEHGVALYMHYSGVWDSEAIRQHPAWGVINADGTTNGNATSFFSPYANRLLIPQLRELAGDYGVDGAWVDGECWASMPDYGNAAIEAFRQATGIQAIPRRAGQPHWYEFLEFNREQYRGYLRHYLAEVRRTHPEFQLCSNWAFTDHMPEAVCAPVDWISGDYSPEDSVNSARFSARYLPRQGKPWDLMAWSFTTKVGEGGRRQKSVVQLQREAAVVLALGGGFQAYFGQRRDGSIRSEHVPIMAEVAKFCRARQKFCHRSMPVPQVALLYSTAAHYRSINGLFNRDLSRMRGTLQALLESQQSVEVLSEHHLTKRMAEYPLIVVPETGCMDPAFRQELVDYVRGGGNLLLVGPQTAALFTEELGARLAEAPESQPVYLEHAGALTPTKDQAQRVELTAAQPFGQWRTSTDADSPARPAASIATLGRGKIAATYFSFSRAYLADRSPSTRSFLHELVRQLFPRPMVEVQGSPDVDVSVNRLQGRLAINLVNTAGPHADVNLPHHDSIPAVGSLGLRVRLPQKPARIQLEPEGRELPFEYREGEARVTLPSLDIHSVVLVD
jgi:alpha-L-fucosidase